MRFEDIKKIVKGTNQLHKMKLYIRKTTGDNIVIWLYCDYEKKSLGLPSLKITDKGASAEETALLRRAIERRNELEKQGNSSIMSTANHKEKVSKIMQEWIDHYTTESGAKNAGLAKEKFLAANEDFPVGSVSRRHINEASWLQHELCGWSSL